MLQGFGSSCCLDARLGLVVIYGDADVLACGRSHADR
jgi:hypothetical protein